MILFKVRTVGPDSFPVDVVVKAANTAGEQRIRLAFLLLPQALQ